VDFRSANGYPIPCWGLIVSPAHSFHGYHALILAMDRAFLIADPLQEILLGRRGAIALACVVSIIATIGQSFSKTPAQLLGCRAITGLTLAAKASTAPLLIAETSPKHLRGKKH
jgi:MFS family permease